MKMTQSNFKAFNKAFAQTVKELEKTFGVSIKLTGGSYTGTSFTSKLTATNTELVNGKSAEQIEFERFAPMYGLKAENYLQSFDLNGENFELYGFNPRAPKNCCSIRRKSDGAKYKCPKQTLGL